MYAPSNVQTPIQNNPDNRRDIHILSKETKTLFITNNEGLQTA